MNRNGTRYLGDLLFDKLNEIPGFIDAARELVEADWRAGTESFRDYARPWLDDIFSAGGFKAYGDLDYAYLERRVMEGVIDMHQDPWLWAYDALIGALVSPAIARTALNGIERSA